MTNILPDSEKPDVPMPTPLLRGTTSSRTISDIMREREPEYEKMFVGADLGYEILGHFYIPPFQRPAVWSDDQMRRLNESIWLGISIGGIVISAEGKYDRVTKKYPASADLLLDGQQRLRSIKAYMKKGLRIFVGTEHEHCWDDLSRRQKRRYESTSISYISIDDNHDMERLKEVYNRLNFGGTNHTEDQRAV